MSPNSIPQSPIFDPYHTPGELRTRKVAPNASENRQANRPQRVVFTNIMLY